MAQDIAITKRMVLDFIFAGYSLAHARAHVGLRRSKGGYQGGYSWLFASMAIREITRNRLGAGDVLPRRAMTAYTAACGSLSREQRTEIKALVTHFADSLIRSLSA